MDREIVSSNPDGRAHQSYFVRCKHDGIIRLRIRRKSQKHNSILGLRDRLWSFTPYRIVSKFDKG
jgi:hypothetical protein